MADQIIVPRRKCLKCGHEWYCRSQCVYIQCPACKSYERRDVNPHDTNSKNG